jgi:hypothetical protein
MEGALRGLFLVDSTVTFFKHTNMTIYRQKLYNRWPDTFLKGDIRAAMTIFRAPLGAKSVENVPWQEPVYLPL